MSNLKRSPSRRPDGLVHRLTPADAGWAYAGLELRVVAEGQSVSAATDNREICLMLIGGHARVVAGGKDFGIVGERTSPLEDPPWSIYLPAGLAWTLEAITPVELAVCSAPAAGRLPARVIPPAEVGSETRGTGTNTRYVRNILPETAPAESLLVAEVVTPGGNWSSYPPPQA